MNRSVLLFSAMLLIPFQGDAFAQDSCRSLRPVRTPEGPLVVTHCKRQSGQREDTVTVGGQLLLRAAYLSEQDFDSSRTRWLFRGDVDPSTGCARQLYALDLATTPASVFAFGVKNACNEFHWASWGDKRSVIALKHNVRFVYESGKLAPPAKGEALWKAIEPPHSGPGLSIEDAIPFVEIVPAPK